MLIEHYPLEQGLRLASMRKREKRGRELIEHYPLEQGLRRLLHTLD